MELHGLNARQRKLADMIWSIQTQEELDAWFSTLPPRDQKTGITLLKLMLYEQIDQEINELDQFPEAENYLKSLLY